MKYLCLANYRPADMAAMPPEAVKALVSQCPAKDAELKATGKLRLSASLGSDKDVIRLEPRGGKTQVTDGPFVESKERQIDETQAALKEADAGDYASDQDVAALAKKWDVRPD